ncbi:MAG: hypothetical protein E7647_04645 [Ruminococcaceae bacterium]|nr:hypothetical protein [Oscillospiraceae bacterium]
MKRIISILLASLIVITGLSFPVFAEDEDVIMTITEDMISAEGAKIEYDSYLSAYKITPDAAGEKVTVRLTENLYTLAMWLPATAADSFLDFTTENDMYLGHCSVAAGHKFHFFSMGFTGENCWFSYTPSDVYSIYLYDKMMGYEDNHSIVDIANGSLAIYEEEYLDLDTYEVERYTKYYWDNDIVFNESFFVLQEPDGTIAPEPLMYDIDRVVSVRNSYLNKEYVYGVDYLVEDGKLVIPEGSSIRSYTYNTVYKETNPSGTYWETLNGDFVHAGQYDMYFVGYMNVTYTVKSDWNGPVPESKGMYLENVMRKLNTEGETVKVLGIGDSIAGGANVSSDIGDTGVSPYADAWCDMTAKAIQERYPDAIIENETIAQGGATATLAIERMDEIVAYDPDLLIIEFGTNECMAGESADYYIDTLTQAIDAVNENIPDCDIILVAPILSNPLIFPADWFYAYADALYTLERQGVAIADSTSIHQYLKSRKDYLDMTGDFLCHPNDFSNRVFVQTIMKTLELDSEEAYIAGLADRILSYRYEYEYDSPDWADFTSLAAAASAEIAASTTADEAREKYMEKAAELDRVPTSADNVANSALDVSKLIFATAKPMDIVGESNTVATKFDDGEKALSIAVSNARTAAVELDYKGGDAIVSADGYDYVVYTVKAPLSNSVRAKASKFTFTTETGACATTQITLTLDGAYHSYIIDMSGDSKWAGNISSLKIQPFASSATNDTLLVSSIVLCTDSENASDVAIERERAANADAAEAVTYLMSDDATTAILTTKGGESYLAGDADGNGAINAVDSLHLRHYLVDGGYQVANPIALDVNADGSIDPQDSLTLKMTLSGILEETTVSGADAEISYCPVAKAAKIVLSKEDALITVDLAESGLSADMFKYVTVCAKAENAEPVAVTVTLTYADGTMEKTLSIPSNELFGASVAKFTEACGEITSISFTFDAEAGETVYLDSFVFTPTLSGAENAVAVRVGAANLY